MKNRYGKLGRTIIIRVLLISALAVATGYGVLTFLAEDGGIWSFLSEEPLYGKLLFAFFGFTILFLLFFLLAVRKMTRYLNHIDSALGAVLAENQETIVMEPELESMTDQLNQLRYRLSCREKQAAESEQRKNELVVCLAHDLKTPLTSVTAYLTMLDEHPRMEPEERARYTHITLEKAIRLEELINEFFEVTRFNVQDIVLERRKINLSIMLEQLEDENYGMLNAKNMTCVVDVQDGLIMQGDPERLARVFDNILKNAAAYGNEGSEILIQARGGSSGITIVFTNEGPQIPEKKLELIFEKFYRVDDGRSSRTGGAGLGLAIARQIVELHGGAISAVSDSKNTRFIVNIPMDSQAAKGDRDEKERRRQKQHKP